MSCKVCKHRLLSNVDLNIRKNKKHGENIPIFCTLWDHWNATIVSLQLSWKTLWKNLFGNRSFRCYSYCAIKEIPFLTNVLWLLAPVLPITMTPQGKAPIKTPTVWRRSRLSLLLRVLQVTFVVSGVKSSLIVANQSSSSHSPPPSAPQASLWTSVSPIFFVAFILGFGRFMPSRDLSVS